MELADNHAAGNGGAIFNVNRLMLEGSGATATVGNTILAHDARHNCADGTPPAGDPLVAQHGAWWAELDLSPGERLRAQHDLATLAQLQEQLAAVKGELARLSQSEPWCVAAPFLIQLPGFAFGSRAALSDVGRAELRLSPGRLRKTNRSAIFKVQGLDKCNSSVESA